VATPGKIIYRFNEVSTATNAPTTTSELAAKMAQDSTSMMDTVLHNPLIPTADPVTARICLPCRISRMTIIRVRRTLSETEIERYGIPKWGNKGVDQANPWDWKYIAMIPIPTLMALVQRAAVGL